MNAKPDEDFERDNPNSVKKKDQRENKKKTSGDEQNHGSVEKRCHFSQQ
jgi:hypothetical protein